MDKIIIRDLLVSGIIGVNADEREKPQDILINIEMDTDTKIAGHSDDIQDCINYSTVMKKVFNHAEMVRRFTVEALAEDIARLCLEDPRVLKVHVRVEKPKAARFTKSVGVEIERAQIV